MKDYLQPFSAYSGPKAPKTLIVGEAWGESEAERAMPFIGTSGQELWRMLGQAWGHEVALHREALPMQWQWCFARREAWLASAGIAFTNVFNLRPIGNNIETICGSRKDEVMLPLLKQGKYFLRAVAEPALKRLQAEICEANPNLIVACGNVATWALLQATNIGGIRGSIAIALDGRKILPTYHPAAVMRNWPWRPIVVADLMKAKRESDSPLYFRPKRWVQVNPTLAEIEAWVQVFLAENPPLLSVDCETMGGQISCISFSYREDNSLVVPFICQWPKWQSYWATPQAEAAAWHWVRTLLEHEVVKLGQNFLYDLQYITRMGILPRNCIADLMLAHHSLHPEIQKGLGFLGSIYTEEASWKLMRRAKHDTVKRDE